MGLMNGPAVQTLELVLQKFSIFPSFELYPKRCDMGHEKRSGECLGSLPRGKCRAVPYRCLSSCLHIVAFSTAKTTLCDEDVAFPRTIGLCRNPRVVEVLGRVAAHG